MLIVYLKKYVTVSNCIFLGFLFIIGLQKITAHAFKHIRGLKRLDLSDNGISNIDYDAFDEVV